MNGRLFLVPTRRGKSGGGVRVGLAPTLPFTLSRERERAGVRVQAANCGAPTRSRGSCAAHGAGGRAQWMRKSSGTRVTKR